MARPEKVQAVAEIVDGLKATDTYYLVDFRGLTVADATDLRNRLRQQGVSLKVVKNTLAKRAAAEAGVVGLDSLLEGPTAVAFCREDPVAAAKALQSFIREKKKLTVKGGYLQHRVLTAAQVDAMASLPSRDELIAKLVGSMAAPLYGLANVLTGPMRGLVVALDQIRAQKAEAA
jgi:large subunit ribosomal protein L10